MKFVQHLCFPFRTDGFSFAKLSVQLGCTCFALSAIKDDAAVIKLLDPKMQSDHNFLLSAVKRNCNVLEHKHPPL